MKWIVFCLVFFGANTKSFAIEPFRYNPDRTEVLQPGRTLKLVTWNVHKYADKGTDKSVINFARTTDLLLIQESMMDGKFQNFYEGISSHQWLNGPTFRTLGGVLTGVTTGTRYYVEREDTILSLASEPIVGTHNMIVITYLPIAGRDELLAVANLHAVTFVSTETFTSQIQQLDEVLSRHKGPIVLAGDFNCYTVGRGLVLRRLSERLGLEYVWPEGDARLMRLDHVFVRGVQSARARVRADLNTSDHLPIEISVILR